MVRGRASGAALAVMAAVAAALGGSCRRAPAPPSPAASASSDARPVADTSGWFALEAVTGVRGPRARLTDRSPTCLDAVGCPFEPVRLPACGAGVPALDVAEVHKAARAQPAARGRLRVRGRLALHERGSLVACTGDRTARVSPVKLPHEADRPCCNDRSGTFVLRGSSEPAPTDLLLTSARGEVDIGAVLLGAASCGGDESALCCPLPPGAPVVVEGEPVVLGERMAPYSVVLTAARLCTEAPAPDAPEAAPTSCADGAFTYRDGTELEHPSRCAECRCAGGTWEPAPRDGCFPIRPGVAADLDLAARAVRRSVHEGGLLGPYFVRPLAAAEPALVRAVHERLGRAGVELAGLHEEPLPPATAPWPARCAPAPDVAAEIWIGRGWAQR